MSKLKLETEAALDGVITFQVNSFTVIRSAGLVIGGFSRKSRGAWDCRKDSIVQGSCFTGCSYKRFEFSPDHLTNGNCALAIHYFEINPGSFKPNHFSHKLSKISQRTS